MSKKSLVVSLILMVFIAFSLNAAVSTKQIVEKAENIIIGKVVDQRAEWNADNTSINTSITINVLEDLKGKSTAKTETIVVPGGKIGEVGLRVDGVPQFNIDEQVILFLAADKNGEKSIVDFQYGKYTIVDNYVVENGKSLNTFKREIMNDMGNTMINDLPDQIQFAQPEILAEKARNVKSINKQGKATSQISGGRYTTIWHDDFESDFPGTDWTLGRNANPAIDNDYTWGKQSYNVAEGEHAVWCSETSLQGHNPDLDAGTDQYANSTMAWMIAGPFDLSDVYAARLAFKIYQKVEPWRDGGPNDWLGVGISVDGVWFKIQPEFQFFRKNTDGWIDYKMNVEDVVGQLWEQDQVWISFMFWSDYQIGEEGTYIDDVILYKLNPGCGAPEIGSLTPSIAPAGTGHTVTLTGNHFTNFLGMTTHTRLDFFSAYGWSGDSIWVEPDPATTEISLHKIVCDVPRGTSSGKIRVIREKDGVGYVDLEVPFGYEGAKWYPGIGNAGGTDYPVIPYSVNPACADVGPATVLNDIKKAATEWNTTGHAMVALEFDGVSSVTMPQFDGKNTVSFAPIANIPFPPPSMTYTWYSNGKILEADIVLNSLYPWAHDENAAPDKWRAIIRNFATNEFGNLLGLSDLYGELDKPKTMYGFHHDWVNDFVLDDHAEDLYPDDIEGVQWIYGPGLTVDFSADNPIGITPITVQFNDKTKSKHPITKWLWDFGDGTTSTEQNPAHTYDSGDNESRYTVSLTAWSDSGLDTYKEKETKKHLVKLNVRIAASVDADPTVDYGPFGVQFQNQTTGSATDYLWDFGDGKTSKDKQPLHVYEEPGIYSVTMTASGPGGQHTEAIAGLVNVYEDEKHVGLTRLVLVEGSENHWPGQGWDNAIDRDTYHTNATTNCGKKGDAWAIFSFNDESEKSIGRVRMMCDTGIPNKRGDYITKFTVMVSTTGMEEADFTAAGTFENTTGDWNDFTFTPVSAKYVKLVIDRPAYGWRQIGEFEIYEHVEMPNLEGSNVEVSTPHVANGSDAAALTISLADKDGNPVIGLSQSAFRIVTLPQTEGIQQSDVIPLGQTYDAPVVEGETLGTYHCSLSSVLPGEQRVIVRVYGMKLNVANTVAFTEPELEKSELAVVSGTDTWKNEGWDNAIDGDVEGADGTVSAGPLWRDCFGIFEFADGETKHIIQYRLLTDTQIPDKRHLVTEYEVYVSTTGTEEEDFSLVNRRERHVGDWEHFVMMPIEAKYIKLKLLEPRKTWRQIGEFEVFTTTPSGLTKSVPGSKSQVAEIPKTFGLEQNYPNPFNPETSISYQIPEASKVVLKVYNMLGQEIRTLVNTNHAAGNFHITWDAKDNAGFGVASGIYFYNIEATAGSKKFSKKLKMTLLR